MHKYIHIKYMYMIYIHNVFLCKYICINVCVCVCVCVKGKRTKVPCKYDSEKRMYVPTGGRDVVPGGKVRVRSVTRDNDGILS